MNLNAERKPATLIFNPFVLAAGIQALVPGLGAILLAGFLGFFSKTHFDGVLDIHAGAPAPLWVFLSEGLIDWLCLALVLLLAGRILSKTRFRIIDVFGTQALARWPTILTTLLFMPAPVQRFNSYLAQQIATGGKPEFASADAALFFAAIIVSFALLCWTVMLMYKAYSVSCNIKGARAIISFIIGVIIAEVLSKVALSGVLKLL